MTKHAHNWQRADNQKDVGIKGVRLVCTVHTEYPYATPTPHYLTVHHKLLHKYLGEKV
jgi:hypothetical protein